MMKKLYSSMRSKNGNINYFNYGELYFVVNNYDGMKEKYNDGQKEISRETKYN